MAIWMGSQGGLALQRVATEQFYANISPADVEPSAKRFSVDKPISSYLITGDRVEISRAQANGVSTSNLDFVHGSAWPDNQQHPDGAWFVAVDQVGGVRLYQTWFQAIAGKEFDAVQLVAPSGSYRLQFRVLEGDERCLARTVEWTLNTNRDVADITSLGEAFRKNMATLVSGSGEIDCFFDYVPSACGGDDLTEETSQYLHRLALRLEIGATFQGIFLIKHERCNPLFNDNETVRQRRLYYSCDCVITQVGIEMDSEDAVHSRITFVTTGEIKLLYNVVDQYLLQEPRPDPYKVLQESEFGVLLEAPE